MSDVAQAAAVRLVVVALRGGEELGRAPVRSDVLRLGRSPDSDLVVDDPAFSRAHAEIEKHGPNHYLIRDLQSRNGLTVRDRRVAAWSIREGDEVLVGPVVLRFELVEGPAPPEPRAKERKLSTTTTLTPGEQLELLERTVPSRGWLRVEADAETPVTLDRDTFVFGADPRADVVLPGLLTPHWCALLARTQAGWELHDIGDKPGRVRIDDVRVGGAAPVRNGQTIRIGGARFTLFDGLPPPELRPRLAGAEGPARPARHGRRPGEQPRGRARVPLLVLSIFLMAWGVVLLGFFGYVLYKVSRAFG